MKTVTDADPVESGLARFVHREYVQLAILVGVTVLLFAVTRSLHHYLEAGAAGDEREWRRLGEAAMARGEARDAVDAFERALSLNRQDGAVALELAHALSTTGDLVAARNVLIPRREASPENGELNLALARLAVARHDVTEAQRFYNYALYAPVVGGEDAARPLVRMELARFLVAHGQPARAISELQVITERPLSGTDRLAVAALLMQAGDLPHALEQYQALERLGAGNAAAVLGEAEVLFSLGNYAAADAKFLRASAIGATPGDDAAVAHIVIDADPLAPRIPAAARRRRLLDSATYLIDTLNACVDRASPDNDDPVTRLADLIRHLRAVPPHEDDVSRGSELVDQTVTWAASRCAVTDARDRALQLIAARHAAGA